MGRSPTATSTIALGERVFAMSLRYPLLVAILSKQKTRSLELELVCNKEITSQTSRLIPR